MRTRNLTPFLLGTKLTSRHPPRPEMTLIVRASFALRPNEPLSVIEDPLGQRFLSAETYADEDDERAGECLFPSDFAEYKLNAEVLLKGTCHAPSGRPVTECPVRFGVGGWYKTLRVVGRRVWSDNLPGAVPSEPLSFTKMPLTWANAFGGPGFARNPVGKGLGATELPTVELVEQPIKSRSDRPEPASFGPINPAWPQRASKIGREYGKSWRESRFPFYAEDFDWTHFHAAPHDQQLQGYLRGDEELLFQNLHPSEPTLRARLPGVRVRVFVHDDAGQFREVGMSIDTLLADLDRGVIELTYRGVTPVRDQDFDDVRTVLVASETLGGKSLPEAHYRDLLLDFEKDPVGLSGALPEHFDDVVRRDRDARAGKPPELRPELDPISARIDQKLGKFGEAQTEAVRNAVAHAREKAAPHRDIEPELAKVAQAIDDTPPAPTIRKPGALPSVGLRRTMRGMLTELEQIKKSLEGKEVPEDARRKIAALEAIPHDPRWAQLDPSYRPPTGPVSTDEPGPGRDLSEQDLTGRDLRNMDLRGANLEGAILTRADLRGADLRGASLRDAILFKTNLEGARLEGADLTRANAARMRAQRADFTGATLEMAFFEDADLESAVLTDARGEYAVFNRTNLAGARAERSSFEHADFTEANLEEAVLSGASLGAGLFLRCRARKARFVRARIAAASFAESNLTGASLADATGEKAIFTGAVLDGADVSHADLPAAHFTKASAKGARLTRANLPEARFYKAKLEGADVVEANLFEADLSRAELSRVKFAKANLYAAKFVGAKGEGTDFTDAILKRSTLERGA
jgi:uncharacterized protein YjbI with pentapeptide repeats